MTTTVNFKDISAADAALLLWFLPDEARQPSSGITYDPVEGLTIPVEYSVTAQATLAKTNWQATPPAKALVAYAAMQQQVLLNKGVNVNVAPSGAAAVEILCDGTNATRADLALLALFGQQSPTGTQVWRDNNGVASTLTGAELVNLATLVGQWIAATYAVVASMTAGANASPPTITTFAQIDAAFTAALPAGATPAP